MEIGYQFRLYPNAQQAELIQKTFGCCRWAYNHYLAEHNELYKETGKAPTRFQNDKDLTQQKKALPWLREPDKCALQNALKNLDAGFQNFFRRVKQGIKPYGYPQFKSKHSGHKRRC